MKLMKILTLLLALLIVSCSKSDKVVNPIDNTAKYFISTVDGTSSLKVVELPSKNVVYNDFFKEVLNLDIDNPTENIVEFNGNYYIIVPKSYKIFVVKKNGLSLQNTIDFSDEQYEPTDIVFANSTDAYIVHRNSVYLTLLDLTNFVKARELTIGNPPHDIAIMGNQIFVTNQSDNTISIVDSREKKEVAKLKTEAVPKFLSISPDGKTVACVTAGLGKDDNGGDQTPAMIQYFDIENRNLISAQELGFNNILASEQSPYGFVITQREWGFVPTNETFFRVDTRSKDRINLITRRSFYFLNYDTKGHQLILLREVDTRTDILFADENSGDIGDFYTFPYKISFVSSF